MEKKRTSATPNRGPTEVNSPQGSGEENDTRQSGGDLENDFRQNPQPQQGYVDDEPEKDEGDLMDEEQSRQPGRDELNEQNVS